MSKKYYTFMIIEIENVINLKIKEIRKLNTIKSLLKLYFQEKRL